MLTKAGKRYLVNTRGLYGSRVAGGSYGSSPNRGPWVRYSNGTLYATPVPVKAGWFGGLTGPRAWGSPAVAVRK
jgi:hypothetical protein